MGLDIYPTCVQLFIIGEIPLLHDNRGPVLEALFLWQLGKSINDSIGGIVCNNYKLQDFDH